MRGKRSCGGKTRQEGENILTDEGNIMEENCGRCHRMRPMHRIGENREHGSAQKGRGFTSSSSPLLSHPLLRHLSRCRLLLLFCGNGG